MKHQDIERNLDNLHDATMTILEKIGVRLHHKEMLEIAKSRGIRVSDDKVFFTRKQIMDWVGKAPSEFTIYGRNADHDMIIGGDHVEHTSYNSGFPFIVDLEGNRRPALFSDYLNFLKLVHQTPAFKINGGVMVTPGDLPNDETLYPTMLYATLLYSDKCIFGGMGGKEESQITLDMLGIVFGGKEALIRKPRIANLVSSLSPLQFDERMLDTLRVYAEYGQPVIVSPAVMAGSTGPVTMAGSIVIANAEALVGVALSQMVREGTPAIYGSATSNTDMRSGAFTIGTPESALAVKYCARLAKRYGLPCRGGGALNDAKNVSVQAGYESMMIQFVANQEKINFNFHSAGGLDSYGAMSYEKFVADLEILGMIEHYLADLNTDPEHLALDVIEQVGAGGEFITNLHTVRHCRTAPFASAISIHGPLKEGKKADDALRENMERKLNSMLDSYAPPALPPETCDALEAYLKERGIDPDIVREAEGDLDHIRPASA